MLLGLFMTTLHMPGIPLLLWGEEQASYVLDSTAANYIFGRAPMSSAIAWQDHGCYSLGSTQYFNFPVDTAARGCHDDSVSLDHRDPSHPVRNIIKSMYRLRQDYPVLNDGWFLQSLSNQTRQVFLPGSNNTPSDTGMWSVIRDQYPGVQNLTGATPAQPVWLVYSNEGKTVDYKFDCTSNETALLSPFPANTTVRNILAPYDELVLGMGPKKLFLDQSQDFNGCVDKLTLAAWDFKAYVPKENWIQPPPFLTKFLPGHDSRLVASNDGNNTVKISFEFSQEMDCDSITKNMIIDSTTDEKSVATIDPQSIVCGRGTNDDGIKFVAELESVWAWSATLVDVPNGIHVITIENATTANGAASTESTDHFMFRIGHADNTIVFPRTANYSSELLFKDPSGSMHIAHKASGADQWRYSLNWGSSYSSWQPYRGGNSTLQKQPWSGTKRQAWKGDHVIVQYFSKAAGSSSHVVHGDAQKQPTPRRFPHLFAHGAFNKFGFDGGVKNEFDLKDGVWSYDLMTEWPARFQLNVWGINPDGKPDQTFVYGDTDGDQVLDRSSPGSLGDNLVNLTTLPPSPFVAYRMELNDATMRYKLVPTGSRYRQLIVFALLWSIPVLTGVISIWTYMGAFYGVKFNASGVMMKKKIVLPTLFRGKFKRLPDHEDDIMLKPFQLTKTPATPIDAPAPVIGATINRRTVLIATMEYDIEDWGIKIKIGGLGVMAQLMGKSLTHQDLIWVVPCVGGIDYPVDRPAEPMTVQVS
jgi:alpha-1,3-glucan synthase